MLLNDKDFFTGHTRTTTQNLSAEIVRAVQIINDYGEQANLTGIKSGERQKRKFGTILAGAGTARNEANCITFRLRERRVLLVDCDFLLKSCEKCGIL